MSEFTIIKIFYYLAVPVRVILSWVFLSAAYGKIKNLEYFENIVKNYKIIPKVLYKPFTHLLPWLELIIGLMILIGWYTQVAMIVYAVLLLVFLLAMGINLARGRANMDCGCSGGRHSQSIGYKSIIRNLSLFVCTLPFIFYGGGILSFDSLQKTTKQLFLRIYLIEILLPMTLIVIGLLQLTRLSRQLLRLVYLIFEEPEQ